MGMRPQMCLVFGVDDFDGGINYDIWETRIHAELDNDKPFTDGFVKDYFFDHKTKEWHYVADDLHYSPGFNPGILGLRIHRTQYDSELVRALSIFHPEYGQAGKLDIPVWDKESHPLYARHLLTPKDTLPRCGDIEFQWSWFYPSVIEQHNMWPVHAYCTRWLLDFAGVSIDYTTYKAMLVWQWS